MLERSGYQVDAVGNGKRGRRGPSNSPYAAVLMDVQMPEMDGYEATVGDPPSRRLGTAGPRSSP